MVWRACSIPTVCSYNLATCQKINILKNKLKISFFTMTHNHWQPTEIETSLDRKEGITKIYLMASGYNLSFWLFFYLQDLAGLRRKISLQGVSWLNWSVPVCSHHGNNDVCLMFSLLISVELILIFNECVQAYCLKMSITV